MSYEEYELMRKLVQALRQKEPLPWQDWMDEFLADLERNRGNASVAIDLSEKSRDTVYKYRRRNEEFDRRWTAITTAARKEATLERVERMRETGRKPRSSATRRCDAGRHPRHRQPLRGRRR